MLPAKRLDAGALVCIAIALVTWSSSYAAIAYTLAAFTPGEIAFARLAVSSLCFVVLMAVTRTPLPPWRDWPALIVLGLLGQGLYQLCLNWAETRIASGTAAILVALVPAATVATSAWWLHERLSPRAWLGLAIALAGTVLVVLASGQHVALDPRALLVLVCVVVTAIYFVGQKPLFARSSALSVTAVTFYAGTLGCLPFAGGLPHALATANGAQLASLVWLGVAPGFAGYFAWNLAMHRASPARVASFIYLSPPMAVVIGWLWLGERPGLGVLFGGAVVLGGVALANARPRRSVAAAAAADHASPV